MVGQHHRLNRHEFGQTPGDSGGQRSLVKSWTRLRDWTTRVAVEIARNPHPGTCWKSSLQGSRISC